MRILQRLALKSHSRGRALAILRVKHNSYHLRIEVWEKRIIKVHYKQEGGEPKTKVLDDSSSYTEQISTFVYVNSASLREKAH